jgi:hypothetical protein
MIRRTPFLIAGLLLLPLAADARTIEMTDMDTVMMAAIHEDFPLSSWTGWKSETGLEYGTGEYTAGTHAATFVQFPLDCIPEGQQIVNAELIIPVHYDNQYPGGVRLLVWRLLVGWGKGVSHTYRQVVPEKLRWSVPGARGPGVDHALTPTRQVELPREYGASKPQVDVTSDVQFWYENRDKNHGWLITTEDQNTWAYLLPSLQDYRWVLRITYEPK